MQFFEGKSQLKNNGNPPEDSGRLPLYMYMAWQRKETSRY
jgi:hypothetical protein